MGLSHFAVRAFISPEAVSKRCVTQCAKLRTTNLISDAQVRGNGGAQRAAEPFRAGTAGRPLVSACERCQSEISAWDPGVVMGLLDGTL